MALFGLKVVDKRNHQPTGQDGGSRDDQPIEVVSGNGAPQLDPQRSLVEAPEDALCVGQWNHTREDKSVKFWECDLFQNIASVGGTMFVELRWCKSVHARHTHDFGMKYFATLYVSPLKGVGNVLEEDQAQDDMFVLSRIQVVAELIGGQPQRRLETEFGTAVVGVILRPFAFSQLFVPTCECR